MITGDFVNGLHIMVGTTSDLDANSKPNVATTSENTFFLVENSGDVFYYSGGEWAEANAAVAGIVAALLNKGALPAVAATDNGKVLKVVDGVWAPGTGGGGGDVTPAAVADAIGGMTAEQIGGVISDLDAVTNPVVQSVTGSTPEITAEDNHVYSCGEITSLTITDSAQNISFKVDFTSGSTATVINAPSGYKAPGGDLTAEANKEYELDVRNGKAVLTAFEAVSASA